MTAGKPFVIWILPPFLLTQTAPCRLQDNDPNAIAEYGFVPHFLLYSSFKSESG
jgi:hypothetical protein